MTEERNPGDACFPALRVYCTVPHNNTRACIAIGPRQRASATARELESRDTTKAASGLVSKWHRYNTNGLPEHGIFQLFRLVLLRIF